MKLKNLLKMGWHTLTANISGHTCPLNVMISLTNRCNSRCQYCNIFNRKQRELTTTEMLALLKDLKRLGAQRIAFWGGEPLVREDIAELINFAKDECDFFLSIDTNGYLVPQKIDILKKIDVLVLSIDGPEKIHDTNREPGSFQKVIKAIETATKKMNVFTITVLTKENLQYIDYILELADKYQFSTTFQLLHHSDELASENEDNLLPLTEQYRKAIEHLITCKKRGKRIVSSFEYLNYIKNWNDYKITTSKESFGLKCWAGKLYCNVDTDGTIYPCSVMIGKMKGLNFLDVGVKQAFDYIKNCECKACTASCFTEYNFMHSLNFKVIYNWY
ncbi:MAG TPA: radical SAM protein, partial [bacterium]|nr:radical SAM protein [bacterium]